MMGRKVAGLALVPALALAACNDPETYREPPRRPALDANGDEVATEPRHAAEPARAEHNSMLPWLLFGASTAHTEWRDKQARDRERERNEERRHHAQPIYSPGPRFRPAEPRRSLSPPRPTPPPSRPSSPPTYRYVPRPTYRSAPTYNRPPTPAYRSSPSRGGR